jgi:hypothetical protein
VKFEEEGGKRESNQLKIKGGLHYFLSFYDKNSSGLGERAECWWGQPQLLLLLYITLLYITLLYINYLHNKEFVS